MPDAGLSLALALATRLCHDLAGTVGALTAALDMAADGGEPEALSLAQDCGRELATRLRLLRAAFSAGGVQEGLAELAAGLPGADRLTVDVRDTPADLDGARGQLAANLMLLGAQALPRGGSIRLSGEPEAMVLEVAGPRAAWPATLAPCVAGQIPVAELAGQPREVGVAVLRMLADALGLEFTVESDTRLCVRADGARDRFRPPS